MDHRKKAGSTTGSVGKQLKQHGQKSQEENPGYKILQVSDVNEPDVIKEVAVGATPIEGFGKDSKHKAAGNTLKDKEAYINNKLNAFKEEQTKEKDKSDDTTSSQKPTF